MKENTIMELVSCEFTVTILQAVNQCREGTNSVVRLKDQNGNTTLWIEAEWVTLPDKIHEAVEVKLCFSDTGRCAYGKIINETIRKIEHKK